MFFATLQILILSYISVTKIGKTGAKIQESGQNNLTQLINNEHFTCCKFT
jgi:hypothetical protein